MNWLVLDRVSIKYNFLLSNTETNFEPGNYDEQESLKNKFGNEVQ